MKLDVDFSDLNLAAAKMQGLDGYLSAIRSAKKTFAEGLQLAKDYVLDNGGTVEAGEETGVTILSLFDDEAFCFQPYRDIDIFYFET